MTENYTLSADWVWVDGKFEKNVLITVKGGMIEKVEMNAKERGERHLAGSALLPGMVNTHSHAFQRGLRGVGERILPNAPPSTPHTPPNTFWTWREGMYRLAQDVSLHGNRLYEWSLAAFQEMLRGGITTVGEFHYLHHLAGGETGEPLGDHWGGDREVLRAAAAAGIRIVLLPVVYQGSPLAPLQPLQRPFHTPDLRLFWEHVDHLRSTLSELQHVGVAVHSIRAVALETTVQVIREAKARGLPCHMSVILSTNLRRHMSETLEEVRSCEELYGLPPVALLCDHVTDLSHFTMVHGTHCSQEEIDKFLALGGHVSVCPLTEGSLGDGIPKLPEMLARGPSRVSLGTDSNARINFTEEMRWLEYPQRMLSHRRGVVTQCEPHPHLGSCGAQLFTIATAGGAESLGIPAGRIAAHSVADFVALRLSASSLRSHGAHASQDPTGLLEAFVFGGGEGAVGGVAVGGKWQIFGEPLWAPPALPTGIPTDPSDSVLASQSPVVQLAHRLIAIPSLSGEEGDMAHFLQSLLSSQGYRVTLQEVKPGRYNVLALPTGTAEGKVLFNSHLDTVPPFFPPSFDGTGETLLLRGRGACDTKSLIAAMVTAGDLLLKEGCSDFGFLFVVGEEVDHCGMIKANELGVNPKYLIVGEPTELRLPKQQKGILKVRLRCHGIAAHSGYPETGKSAIDELLVLLTLLKAEPWPVGPLGPCTLNVGTISGGTAANVLADSAEALLMWRLVVDPSQVEERLRTLVGDRGEIEVMTKNPPVDLAHVGEFPTGTVNFNTDIPYFSFDGKAFLYGAGSITDAHTPREHVRVSDLEQCVHDYVRLARTLLHS